MTTDYRQRDNLSNLCMQCSRTATHQAARRSWWIIHIHYWRHLATDSRVNGSHVQQSHQLLATLPSPNIIITNNNSSTMTWIYTVLHKVGTVLHACYYLSFHRTASVKVTPRCSSDNWLACSALLWYSGPDSGLYLTGEGGQGGLTPARGSWPPENLQNLFGGSTLTPLTTPIPFSC